MNIDNHSREEIALWAEGGGEARERWMPYKVFMFVIALFLLLPGSLLVSIGWSYFGGGPGFEKIHPATYLLVAVSSWALIVNRSFRWRCIAYSVSDCAFIAFALAALSTVVYAIAVSGASASNFIDTFVVALIIRIAIVAVPRRPMVQFRTFIDIYCIVTIVLVFVEYMLNRNFIPQTVSHVTPYIATIFDTPTTETDTAFRSAGLFDHPLSAAGFLALYSILNSCRNAGSAFVCVRRPATSCRSFIRRNFSDRWPIGAPRQRPCHVCFYSLVCASITCKGILQQGRPCLFCHLSGLSRLDAANHVAAWRT